MTQKLERERERERERLRLVAKLPFIRRLFIPSAPKFTLELWQRQFDKFRKKGWDNEGFLILQELVTSSQEERISMARLLLEPSIKNQESVALAQIKQAKPFSLFLLLPEQIYNPNGGLLSSLLIETKNATPEETSRARIAIDVFKLGATANQLLGNQQARR